MSWSEWYSLVGGENGTESLIISGMPFNIDTERKLTIPAPATYRDATTRTFPQYEHPNRVQLRSKINHVDLAQPV
jgi:hypothetical protein